MLKWITQSFAFGLRTLVGAHFGTRLALQFAHAPTPPQLAFLMDNPFRRMYRDPVRIIDFVGAHRNSFIVDAGCGMGPYTLEAAQRVGPNGCVYAVDMQAHMVNAVARQVEAHHAPNVVTLLAPLQHTTLPANSMDCVVMTSVLSEVKDRHATLAEVRRVLKPGGSFVVGEELLAPRYTRPATTRKWVERAGFKLTGRSGNGFAYLLKFIKPVSAVQIAFGEGDAEA